MEKNVRKEENKINTLHISCNTEPRVCLNVWNWNAHNLLFCSFFLFNSDWNRKHQLIHSNTNTDTKYEYEVIY